MRPAFLYPKYDCRHSAEYIEFERKNADFDTEFSSE